MRDASANHYRKVSLGTNVRPSPRASQCEDVRESVTATVNYNQTASTYRTCYDKGRGSKWLGLPTALNRHIVARVVQNRLIHSDTIFPSVKGASLIDPDSPMRPATLTFATAFM